MWRLAQQLLPLAMVVGVYSGTYLALPLVVVGLWKGGFPETVSSILDALSPVDEHERPATLLRAFAYFCEALGIICHHSATAWVVSASLVGLIELPAHVFLPITVPLVLQHWIATLK